MRAVDAPRSQCFFSSSCGESEVPYPICLQIIQHLFTFHDIRGEKFRALGRTFAYHPREFHITRNGNLRNQEKTLNSPSILTVHVRIIQVTLYFKNLFKNYLWIINKSLGSASFLGFELHSFDRLTVAEVLTIMAFLAKTCETTNDSHDSETLKEKFIQISFQHHDFRV